MDASVDIIIIHEGECQTPYARTITSQQTLYIGPILRQGWADVADAGPTLTQHWLKDSCLQVFITMTHSSNYSPRISFSVHIFQPKLL